MVRATRVVKHNRRKPVNPGKTKVRSHIRRLKFKPKVKSDAFIKVISGEIKDTTFTQDAPPYSFFRYDLSKAKRIGSGRDRAVYELPSGKIIKIAKNQTGILQNTSECEQFLSPNVAECFDSGEDYVVVEKINTKDKRINIMVRELKKLSIYDFDKKTSKLQTTMEKFGLSDFLNYDLAWGDFTRKSSWGMREDGTPVLIDAGTLNNENFKGIPLLRKEWSSLLNHRSLARARNLTIITR